jgi:hypothetical protein
VDLSQLSALQRLSLENQAKKSPGAGSLASFARKSGSKPTPSGSHVAERKSNPLVAIAANRRFGSGAKNASVSSLGRSTLQAKGVPPLPDAKISKLAQKIKLAHSISGNRTDVADINAVNGAPQTPQSEHGPPPSPDEVDCLFQAPPGSSSSTTSTTYPTSLTARANPSPFGSLLATGWHTPVSKNTSVPSIYTASSKVKFLFDSPSPDDVVEAKRVGTRLAKTAKEREGH